MRTRKEIYCENCGSKYIIATVQIVPDTKPLEPSKAVELADRK